MVGPNFGDYLTPWIIKKLTGQMPIYADQNSGEHYLVTGSILTETGPNSIIWGAGFANQTDKIGPHKKIIAVRGPLSRDNVHKQGLACPNVVGDPALLMPRLYKPDPTPKRYRLGVIPHWIDYYTGTMRFRDCEGVRIIDILRKPEEFIDEIMQCEKVISSSLHGIIASHAYGVPCSWVKLSDNICGDGFKYRDYFASVGIRQYVPADYRYLPTSVDEIYASILPSPAINTDALWASRPFTT